MKHLKLIILSTLFAFALQANAQKTFTHYAKAGVKTTLHLKWTNQNYGNIQWQRSNDKGQTWKDISGATAKEYTFTPSTDEFIRVIIKGDEACKPIIQTHIIKTSTFNINLLETTANTATFQLSNFSIPRSEITEWGFCHNFYNLSRNLQNMYREKIGTELPNTRSEERRVGKECAI